VPPHSYQQAQLGLGEADRQRGASVDQRDGRDLLRGHARGVQRPLLSRRQLPEQGLRLLVLGDDLAARRRGLLLGCGLLLEFRGGLGAELGELLLLLEHGLQFEGSRCGPTAWRLTARRRNCSGCWANISWRVGETPLPRYCVSAIWPNDP
jgi:hypothetical protein